jgi:hypothetical protein
MYWACLGCLISPCYSPFSLGTCVETYEPFISLIFQFFCGRGKPRITEITDTESADTGARLYLLFFHSNNGHMNVPERDVIRTLPVLFCFLDAFQTSVTVLETECPSELQVTDQSREKLETSCYRIQKNGEGFMIR